MSCGDEGGADLPGVTYKSGRLRVPVVLLVSMLLVGCANRSLAWKTDPDVSYKDPIPLVLVGFARDYRDCVSKCVGIEQVYFEPFADRCVRLRKHLLGSCLSGWVYMNKHLLVLVVTTP